jgi:transposase-like protein
MTSHRPAIRSTRVARFPTEQAALKCLYLTTRSLDPKGKARWAMRWKPALNALAFEDRITPSAT